MAGRLGFDSRHADRYNRCVSGFATAIVTLIWGVIGPERVSGQAPAVTIDHPIVVTQLPVGLEAERTPSPSDGMQPNDYGDGARIVLLSAQVSPRVLPEGFHSACDPDVRFDGKKLLFAGKSTARDNWNIYEIAMDGTGLRQITRGSGNCRSPSYQSDYYQISDESVAWRQMTFVSSRAGELNEHGSGPATSLYSSKLDGTGVHRLTFNLSSDLSPHLLWDGRLAYGSWQRRTLEHGPLGRVVLLGINADGTDAAPLVGGDGRLIKHMPCSTTGGLIVFVEADRVGWDGAGMLSCVTLRRPLHTYRPMTDPSEGLFHSPSSLPDGSILVSRRPADGSGTHDVYRFDLDSKRMELVFADSRYHNIQAKRVAPRPRPDGRSSSVVLDDPRGRLFCLNLYQNDLPDRAWMPPGTVTRLRVLEGIPRRTEDPATAGVSAPAHTTGAESRPVLPQLATRQLLGEVPVAQDGSFQVDVPANTPIELQLIDENGLSLRSCGWIWTRNHFNQGCIGCHEDPELTPENAMVQALEGPSLLACPPRSQRSSVDFRRDVMPTVIRKCLPCHGPGRSPPDLTSGRPIPTDPADRPFARRIYELLLEPAAGNSKGQARGRYVDPGQARTSRLAWHLFGRNLSRPWDGAVAEQDAVPIPPDPPITLNAKERVNFVTWIDMGAPWAATPGEGEPLPTQ